MHYYFYTLILVPKKDFLYFGDPNCLYVVFFFFLVAELCVAEVVLTLILNNIL